MHRHRARRDAGARPRRATISGCWKTASSKQIASFDAAATPASIALLLDDSPSIYRELGETREAARSLARSLGPEDEVAVAAFADQTHLLLPFSRDRTLLAAALASPALKRVANSSQSFIYQAVYLTAHELFRGRSGRKAIVLLTDGEDSGLGLTWDPASMQARPGAASPLAFDDVARELASQGIALYVISTESRPRAMTDAWLAEHQREPVVTPEARRLGTPLDSLYLAEMVRQAGGDIYFLREMGGLAERLPAHRAGARRRVHARLLSRPRDGAAGMAGAGRGVEARRERRARRRASQPSRRILRVCRSLVASSAA